MICISKFSIEVAIEPDDPKCDNKFERKEGIFSPSLGVHNNIETTTECAQKCNQLSCCSYKWEPRIEQCQLNKECDPNGQVKKLHDLVFCQRKSSGEESQSLY